MKNRKVIRMLDRHLDVPEEWVLLNPDKAEDCRYAYAVCVKESDDQPMIWFSSCCYTDRFSMEEAEDLKKTCVGKKPMITRVWDSYCCGIFAISIVSESGVDEEVYKPYGAKIVCKQKG